MNRSRCLADVSDPFSDPWFTKPATSKATFGPPMPTGLEVVDDYLLACGGVPIGSIGEVFGLPDTGKTAFGLQLVANVQRLGGLGYWLSSSSERLIDRALAFGVNPEALLVSRAGTLEGSFDLLQSFLSNLQKDNVPKIVVWDSLASTPLEGQGDLSIAAQEYLYYPRSVVLGARLPPLYEFLRRANAALVFVNHISRRLNVIVGTDETSIGGREYHKALSWRMSFTEEAPYCDASPGGKNIYASVVVSRFGPPLRGAFLRLVDGTSWDNTWSLVCWFCSEGVPLSVSAYTREDLCRARDCLRKFKSHSAPSR